MVIVKVLNNNVVQAKRMGRDVIVQEKGIAFGKKAGDRITLSQDGRIYELDSSVEVAYVKSLLDAVPAEYWEFAGNIQIYVEERLGYKPNTTFYFSMLDHFYAAVERVKRGIVLNEMLCSDVQYYYMDIYNLACEIVEMAEEKFNVDFGKGEVYFISTHLLDACLGAEESDALKAAETVVNSSLAVIKNEFGSRIDENSFAYTRFLTHLRLFAGRVICESQLPSTTSGDISALTSLQTLYPAQKKCLDKIVKRIRREFEYQISPNERFYLLLHLVQITES